MLGTEARKLCGIYLSHLMSTQASVPVTAVCSERRLLGEAYLQAWHAVHELLGAQAASLLACGTPLDRIDLALTRARERRDKAKLAYTTHIQVHGC